MGVPGEGGAERGDGRGAKRGVPGRHRMCWEKTMSLQRTKATTPGASAARKDGFKNISFQQVQGNQASSPTLFGGEVSGLQVDGVAKGNNRD